MEQDNTQSTNMNKYNLSFFLLVAAFISIGVIILIIILSLVLPNPFKNFTQTKNKGARVNASAQKSLISSFPDFPVYPGARVTNSQSITDIKGQYYQAYFDTSAGVSEVVNWYVSQLETMGWKIESKPDTSNRDDESVIAAKAELKATVNAEREDNKTTISIYIGAK